jgi:hypothetical protein
MGRTTQRDLRIVHARRVRKRRQLECRAELIEGYKAEEIIGKHVSTFYTSEEVENGYAQKNLTTAAATGRAEEERAGGQLPNALGLDEPQTFRRGGAGRDARAGDRALGVSPAGHGLPRHPPNRRRRRPLPGAARAALPPLPARHLRRARQRSRPLQDLDSHGFPRSHFGALIGASRMRHQRRRRSRRDQSVAR